MPSNYFSDREKGPRPQIREEIDAATWGGLVAVIRGLVSTGALGADFPDQCPDGQGPIGTDESMLKLAIQGEIPSLDWPLQPDTIPPTIYVLDFLEFCYEHVGEPIKGSLHRFFGHYHLSFDRDFGRCRFRENVNRILARNGLAYELGEDGEMTRRAGPILQEALTSQFFDTGDSKLDELLESARKKFFATEAKMRREAVEKLWDAWERVKSLELPNDKRASTKAILDKAAPDLEFQKLIEDEARSLTEIGNTFHIRHSETNQIEIQFDKQVDYLFHRLFALIWLLLCSRKT